MVALPIFGGPLKREIVKRAYGMCGQASYEFALDAEEMTAGVQALNDAMALLPGVPYNFPAVSSDGTGDEESGLGPADTLGASVMTARTIALQIGRDLKLSPAHLTAERSMIARYCATPQMELGRNTIIGAGNRYRRWQGPFFTTDASTTEIPQ